MSVTRIFLISVPLTLSNLSNVSFPLTNLRYKLRFSIRALEKDPFDWFKENKKKEGSVITTRVHEVLKTGVKVSIDPEKDIIVMIKKNQLAKEASDARPEIFVPGNALDAMITELDLEKRLNNITKFFTSNMHIIVLSVKDGEKLER